MNFMGQQDCGISIEFYLQQTQNPHLGGLMYYSVLPEVSGTRTYMVDVDLDELDLAEERCCYRPPQSCCSHELTQL